MPCSLAVPGRSTGSARRHRRVDLREAAHLAGDREQGVDHPIDYRSQDFAEEVRRISGGEGIDVAFDALGPSSFR